MAKQYCARVTSNLSLWALSKCLVFSPLLKTELHYFFEPRFILKGHGDLWWRTFFKCESIPLSTSSEKPYTFISVMQAMSSGGSTFATPALA